jgi:hypothetical protein
MFLAWTWTGCCELNVHYLLAMEDFLFGRVFSVFCIVVTGLLILHVVIAIKWPGVVAGAGGAAIPGR